MFQKGNNSVKQTKYIYNTEKFIQQLNTHKIASELSHFIIEGEYNAWDVCTWLAKQARQS